MLKPVKRQSLSEQAFNQLRNDILGSGYKPGDRLPSERELCHLLKINRSSVREALKRLEQSRLIEVRHGHGSVVLDFRHSAGFDMLNHLVRQPENLNYLTARSITELRVMLCAEAAWLAGQRIQKQELDLLLDLVSQIETCEPDNLKKFQELDWEFLYTIARSSENIAMLLLFNSIKDTYFKLRFFFTAMFTQTMASRHLYRRIYNALKARQADTAKVLCKQLIEQGNRSFLEAYNTDRLTQNEATL